MTHMEKGEIALADIVKAVARATRISVENIRTHDGRTNGPVARARQMICWIARGFTSHSWSEIAKAAGYRHHDRAIAAAQACANDAMLVELGTDVMWKLASTAKRTFFLVSPP